MNKTQAPTQGEIKRAQKEEANRKAKEEREAEQLIKHQLEYAKSELMGSYKKIIIDNFIKIFNKNYGDSVDYNSIIDGLKFTMKDNKGSLSPSFEFDIGKVKFRSDLNKENKKFNENQYKDFISNHEIITGENLSLNNFTNEVEYNNFISTVYDGEFIPTSTSEEIYGDFNRINKILGYTPKEETGKIASKESQQLWDNNKSKIMSSIDKNKNSKGGI